MSTSDWIRNKTGELKGRSKEVLGRAGGDRRLEAEGRAERMRVSLRRAGRKVRDAFTR